MLLQKMTKPAHHIYYGYHRLVIDTGNHSGPCHTQQLMLIGTFNIVFKCYQLAKRSDRNAPFPDVHYSAPTDNQTREAKLNLQRIGSADSRTRNCFRINFNLIHMRANVPMCLDCSY